MTVPARLALPPALLAAALAATAPGCAEEPALERVVPERGTLGEEIYEVVCQRFASEEIPEDVSGRTTRDLCAGDAGPDRAPTPRLRALAANRPRLVRALDAVMPEALYDDLDRFMLQLLPFYEPPDDRLPRQTRALATMIARMAADDDAVAALERLGQRVGYRPLRVALGAARPMLAYPDMDEFLAQALATIDDGGPAGEEWDALLRVLALDMAAAEPDPAVRGPTTLALTRDLLFTERDAFRATGTSFMVRRDERGIALPFGSVVAPPFVDADSDGLADVDDLGRFVDGRGELLDVPSPFRRLGESGVARDPAGRATAAGSSQPLYDYFDVDRTLLAAIVQETPPLFEPAAPTLLDLAYGVPALMGPPMPRTADYGRATLSFEGWDTRSSPVFDLLHGIGAPLAEPETAAALAAAEALLRDHEAELAAVIDAGLRADAIADAVPEARLEPNAELWDDVIRVAEWIAAEPGLLEALLRSLADPRSRRLGQIFGDMMRYRDRFALNPDDINASFEDVVFTELVDRGQPDRGPNQSLFQRSISMIHDLNGVRVCNKEGARLVMDLPVFGEVTLPFLEFGECELLEIEDVAQEYALAIIGRGELVIKPALLNALLDFAEPLGLGADDLLESQSGIDGLTTRPTPQALNRFLFAPPTAFLSNLTDPPRTRDGVAASERHDPVVLSWERRYHFCDDIVITPEQARSGMCPPDVLESLTFYDALTPLLEAFDDHDRRTEGERVTPGDSGPRFLFAELISSQHLHWPSPASTTTQRTDEAGPFFAHQSAAVRYEPIVADVFAECVPDGPRCTGRGAGLVARLHDLQRALVTVEVGPGVDGVAALAAAAEVLLDPARTPDLRDRRGATTTGTNGGRRVVPVTPLYLILDALSGMDAAFAAAPDRHAPWLAGRGRLVDQLFDTDCATGACRLRNPRTRQMLLVGIPFLSDRLADHRAAGDLQPWAYGFGDRAEETLASPVATAILRFLDAVQTDAEARGALTRLLAYLVDEASSNDAFDTMRVVVADLLQILEDDHNLVPLLHAFSDGVSPVARAAVGAGEALRLEGSALDETLALLREIHAIDDRRVLRTLMAEMVELPESGDAETPLETILDVVAEVNRAERAAGDGSRFGAEDYRVMLGRTHELLSSEERGLERLYDVIESRELDD